MDRAHAKEDYFLVANRAGDFAGAPNSEDAATKRTGTIALPRQIVWRSAFRLNSKSPTVWIIGLTERGADQPPANAGRREVVRYLASVDMDGLMSRGRSKAASHVARSNTGGGRHHGLGRPYHICRLEDVHPRSESGGGIRKKSLVQGRTVKSPFWTPWPPDPDQRPGAGEEDYKRPAQAEAEKAGARLPTRARAPNCLPTSRWRLRRRRARTEYMSTGPIWMC